MFGTIKAKKICTHTPLHQKKTLLGYKLVFKMKTFELGDAASSIVNVQATPLYNSEEK